jgi:hypothetical protein
MCPGGSVPALMLSRSRRSHGGGGSLEGGVWRYKHNNQPDKDEDEDEDEDEDDDDDDDEDE